MLQKFALRLCILQNIAIRFLSVNMQLSVIPSLYVNRPLESHYEQYLACI